MWPSQSPVYYADVPLRGPDFGKWSDVPQFLALIGTGRVLNFGLRLRPFHGSGAFKGVHIIGRLQPATCKDGRITVSAGSDPNLDTTVRLGALANGDFDPKNLSLAVLSQLDFSRIAPCDLELTLVSPIGVGASLGTSAAVSVGILRAFLGPGYPAEETARLAVDAESRIAGRNTGNQDQVASAFGSSLQPSACQSLTIRDLYDFEVRELSLGAQIRRVFAHTVAVYIGGHDSSDIHLALVEELSSDPELAREKIMNIRACADLAEQSVEADDASSFRAACEALLAAQRGLSPRLINATVDLLLATAASCGAEALPGACVPGAGGRGGTLILHLDDAATLARFAEKFAATPEFADCRLYEVCLADEPTLPRSL